MRRSLLAALVTALAALMLVTAPARAGAAPRSGTGRADAVVAAQQPDAPADDGTGGSADDGEQNPQPAVPEQHIIPRPNSGHEPTEAGDRGGALQILVLVAIVAGVGTIALLAARDVRRSRSRAQADQPSEPYSSQAS